MLAHLPWHHTIFHLALTVASSRQMFQSCECVILMAMNASGVRDTARVLPISPTTVIKD